MKQQTFKIKEAAVILGVSYTWLDRQIRLDKVKCIKLGERMRAITIEEIERVKKEGVQ